MNPASNPRPHGGETETKVGLREKPILLGDLVREIPGAHLISGDPTLPIRGVHHDSRRISPGDLFVARAGQKEHGERFIETAVQNRGAEAVLLQQGSRADTCGAARIEVADVPKALAFAAESVYGHPTRALSVIGITGTNGKTTTTHLLQACINGCGGKAGIVGTLGYRFGDMILPASHTSPEADELSRIAAGMVLRGATHLVMEVSSIALAAARVEATHFKAAAFTNLTQDHLDYHGTMDAYAAAKERLFTELCTERATINVDDPFGKRLAEKLAYSGASNDDADIEWCSNASITRLSCFSSRPEAHLKGIANFAPIELNHAHSGISMRVHTPAGEVQIQSLLVGAHNVANLLTALSAAWLLDLDLNEAALALSAPITVPGRLERCDLPGSDDVAVLVDYAHSPDALIRVLESVRGLGDGRLLCVFGCGGDRDPLKRPLMGRAVGDRADIAFVTNDNPRSEDPMAIAQAILPGLQGTKAQVILELDRAKAIEEAILSAKPGDIVLIAGKGHEPYQIIGAHTYAFDDREQARLALEKRRGPKSQPHAPQKV